MGTQVYPILQQVHPCFSKIFIRIRIILADPATPLSYRRNPLSIHDFSSESAFCSMNGVRMKSIMLQHVSCLKHLALTVHIFSLPVMDPLGMGKSCLSDIFDLVFDRSPIMKIIVIICIY